MRHLTHEKKRIAIAASPLCVVNIVFIYSLQVLVGLYIDLVISDYRLAELPMQPPYM